MAKKNETTAKTLTKSSSGESGDSCQSYTYVRTALDSVQFTAIKYYVAGTSAADKEQRGKQIGEIMKNAIEELNRIQSMNNPDCPPGEYQCSGFCVPYNCP